MKNKMNNFLLTFIYCIGFYGISANPILKISGREEVQLGNFDQTIEKKVNFKITNTGDATLIIDRITKSCSCISANIQKKKIEKGETATVIVKFKADSSTLGHFIKSIFIHSNDSKQKIKKLSIWGYVNPE